MDFRKLKWGGSDPLQQVIQFVKEIAPEAQPLSLILTGGVFDIKLCLKPMSTHFRNVP